MLGALAYSQESLLVTISFQNSPYKLPKGLNLYSSETCASLTTTRVRVISAGQIRQIAEVYGISFQDPALLPPMIAKYVGHSWQGKVLTGISLSSTGIAIGGASLAAFKTSQPNISNAHTWDEVAIGTAVLGATIPLLQKALQADVTTQQTTITNGVSKSLITDMTTMYTVPVGGCSSSVMFIGAGGTGVVKGVLQ